MIHNNHRIFDVPTASKCPTISGGTNTLTTTPTPNPVCHLSNYSGTKSYGAHNTTTTISGESPSATARPNTLTISAIT